MATEVTKPKIHALPLWFRLSLWWGSLLIVSRRLWWPLFGLHWQRAWVFMWAGDGDVCIDALDVHARQAVLSVSLEPAPRAGLAGGVKVGSEFED